MKATQIITVTEILDEVGRAKLKRLLKVSKQQLSSCATSNQFPAKYFVILEAECLKAGIECPRYLFSFVQQSVAAA